MKLTEMINKTIITGALALSMYACTNYNPHIEVQRKDDGNYLRMEMKDGRVINGVSRDYIKIDIKNSVLDIQDSVTYEIDGQKQTIPLYIQKTVTTKGTFSEKEKKGLTDGEKFLIYELWASTMD
jgi:hypothetical protein